LRKSHPLPTVFHVRRLIGFLLFLVCIDESTAAYSSHMFAPFTWVHSYVLDPTAIKLRPFDLVMLAILIVSSSKRDGSGPYVPQMKSALFLVLGTTVLWFVLGVLRGGDARNASWQTYLILSTILFAFTIASTFRTPAHYRGLAKWFLAAALYRAVMCWISYFTWGREKVGEAGAYLTSHEDTITWILAILSLIVDAVTRRSAAVTSRNLMGILLFVGAIQWNSRRLAWVSLGMGLVVMYFLFPKGVAKRRIARAVKMFAPVLLLYVVVGWGSQAKIFLPLRSLSSVSTHEDSSTLARNAENLGLIATANYNSTLTGTGWGRPYVCLTRKYDISAFELWQYMPHNSILGLLAFTGMLGFAGFWLAMPTAVFLNARVAQLSKDPIARDAGIVAASQLIVCANQLYADMGIFSPAVMYVLAICYGMALRLPRATGVWVTPTPKAASPSATP
jgi:hypothetical protein